MESPACVAKWDYKEHTIPVMNIGTEKEEAME